MNQAEFDRINELARKAKTEGLTEEEKQEQASLRASYIAAYRASLRAQLDNLVIHTPDGKEQPLSKKAKNQSPS